MHLLNHHQSEILDKVIKSPSSALLESIRELHCAETDAETDHATRLVRLAISNQCEQELIRKGRQQDRSFELAVTINVKLRQQKASNIRDAVKHAQAALDDGADPCEALCIIEDYANSIDPDRKDNVVSISQVARHE